MNPENKPENLIKMVNQICKNMRAEGEADEVAQLVADHLKRFWTPAMINKLSSYAHTDCTDLTPTSKAAIENLKPDQ